MSRTITGLSPIVVGVHDRGHQITQRSASATQVGILVGRALSVLIHRQSDHLDPVVEGGRWQFQYHLRVGEHR
ncbi:MAG: hypothetical protein U5L05_16040 [Rubrivivax sp.]|nr:hypothetical protein [Rubrivivax sp.]